MTLTYDISTDIGRVRLSVGDYDITTTGAGVKPNGDNFSDEELQVYLDDVSEWQVCVPLLLRTLSNMYAVQSRVVELDNYSEDLRNISKALREQAEEWEKKMEVSDWSTAFGSLASEANSAPFFFGTEQFDTVPDDQRTTD